jgi:thymidylate synthase (FAD)
MRIIEPSTKILIAPSTMEVEANLEYIGRTAYQSDPKGNLGDLLTKILKRNHLSVIEHASITVEVICDRGVSHEIVRHRLAAYTQESTRFCNYSKENFGGHITFIKPCFLPDIPLGEFSSNVVMDPFHLSRRGYAWWSAMIRAEESYFAMLKDGSTAQEARSVLPNSLKTSLVMTMNLREWKHFFSLRTASDAHPQMKEIMIPLFQQFKDRYPIIFN